MHDHTGLQVTVEAPIPTVRLIRVAGRLDQAAAASVLRLVSVQLDLIAGRHQAVTDAIHARRTTRGRRQLETIYQGLYHGGKAGLSRTLTTRLRTRRPLRKRRRRAEARRGVRFIAPARLIEHRPAQVESRSRVGDWEGELIVGRLSQSAIGT